LDDFAVRLANGKKKMLSSSLREQPGYTYVFSVALTKSEAFLKYCRAVSLFWGTNSLPSEYIWERRRRAHEPLLSTCLFSAVCCHLLVKQLPSPNVHFLMNGDKSVMRFQKPAQMKRDGKSVSVYRTLYSVLGSRMKDISPTLPRNAIAWVLPAFAAWLK